MTTPQIYKMAYTNTNGCFYLFENTGTSDYEIARFIEKEDLIHYLDTSYTKVGQITDYNLYIKN
jgi:hypothetical protein